MIKRDRHPLYPEQDEQEVVYYSLYEDEDCYLCDEVDGTAVWRHLREVGENFEYTSTFLRICNKCFKKYHIE